MITARQIVARSLKGRFFKGAPLRDYAVDPTRRRTEERIVYEIVEAYPDRAGKMEFDILILDSTSKSRGCQIYQSVFLEDILADSQELPEEKLRELKKRLQSKT
ncbi:hypothetical protein HYW76_01465 [Candidatus Pacearchaeota archaeon]|nr:hypothetical protein [Candidatus Pacearchaeota archaeon]